MGEEGGLSVRGRSVRDGERMRGRESVRGLSIFLDCVEEGEHAEDGVHGAWLVHLAFNPREQKGMGTHDDPVPLEDIRDLSGVGWFTLCEPP